MAITLAAGDKAPDLAIEDQEGKTQSLADYAGKNVVLYFYPRDNTPGCTKEGCSFRDNHAALQREGAVVLGVSTDSAKFELPFPLLVDGDTTLATSYGAWGEKTLYGKKTVGMNRSTPEHR